MIWPIDDTSATMMSIVEKSRNLSVMIKLSIPVRWVWGCVAADEKSRLRSTCDVHVAGERKPNLSLSALRAAVYALRFHVWLDATMYEELPGEKSRWVRQEMSMLCYSTSGCEASALYSRGDISRGSMPLVNAMRHVASPPHRRWEFLV